MNINYKNFVLLKTKKIADFFIKELYPYHINYIILTGDDSYPKDKNIRNQAWNTIYSKEDISIIVIGKESTPKLKKAKTNRIFVLDDLLLCDLLDIESGGAIKYYIKNRRLNFSKINFINLIYCFFETDNTKIIDVKKYTNFTTSNNWKTKLLN